MHSSHFCLKISSLWKTWPFVIKFFWRKLGLCGLAHNWIQFGMRVIALPMMLKTKSNGLYGVWRKNPLFIYTSTPFFLQLSPARPNFTGTTRSSSFPIWLAVAWLKTFIVFQLNQISQTLCFSIPPRAEEGWESSSRLWWSGLGCRLGWSEARCLRRSCRLVEEGPEKWE
jgi:hypothetical protein